MNPQLQRIGTSQSPVVIIDDFSGAAEEIGRIANSLAPFPPCGHLLSGRSPHDRPADEQAYAYVMKACESAAPFIGGGFGF